MVRRSQHSEVARKSALTHRCLTNDAAPWTTPATSLVGSAPAPMTTADVTWFWSETALARLLRSTRDCLEANGDPALDQLAFGIAR